MPMIVEDSDLERANGRLFAAEIVMNEFAGPPLGSFLYATLAAAPFFLDGASLVASVALLLLMGGPLRAMSAASGAETLKSEIAEGLKWLWRHRVLRTLGVMLGVQNMHWAAAHSILVLFALNVIGVDESTYGLLLAASSIGAFIGSVAATRISRAIGQGSTLLLVVILSAGTLAVISLIPNPILTGAMLAINGFCAVAWNVITVSLRQATVPAHLLGRVNSVYRLLGWGPMPVGAALGGLMADTFGLRAPFIVGALVLTFTGLLALPLVNNRTIAAARRSN